MQQENARYTCEGIDGRLYTVVEMQDVLDASTKSDPHATALGMKSFWVGSRHVDFVDENTFRTPSGVTLRRT